MLLAVEDSVSQAYRHSVAGELGTTSSNPQAVTKGFIVHSMVLLDGYIGATGGLIEQRRCGRGWARPSVAGDLGVRPGGRHYRNLLWSNSLVVATSCIAHMADI